MWWGGGGAGGERRGGKTRRERQEGEGAQGGAGGEREGRSSRRCGAALRGEREVEGGLGSGMERFCAAGRLSLIQMRGVRRILGAMDHQRRRGRRCGGRGEGCEEAAAKPRMPGIRRALARSAVLSRKKLVVLVRWVSRATTSSSASMP